MLYEKNYWINYYGAYINKQAFIEGVIATLFAFGKWENNVQVVGDPPTPILDIIQELQMQLLPKKETENESTNK